MIPDAAVEAAANVLDPRTMGSGGALAEKFKAETRADARSILEAAAPHMSTNEQKLAAIIVLLDPFERGANWMTTDEDAGRYAIEAINNIRGILDTP